MTKLQTLAARRAARRTWSVYLGQVSAPVLAARWNRDTAPVTGTAVADAVARALPVGAFTVRGAGRTVVAVAQDTGTSYVFGPEWTATDVAEWLVAHAA